MKHRIAESFGRSTVSEWQQERLAVLQTLRVRGPQTPSGMAAILDRPIGTMKRLMWTMAKEGQLVGGGRRGYSARSAAPTT